MIRVPFQVPLPDSGESAADTEVLHAVGNVIGDNELTDLVVAGGILLGSLVVASLARTVIHRLLDKGPTDSLLGELIGRVVGYLVVAFGLVYSLDSLGIAIGPLLGALGVVGIALAFALQSVLENFVAGVLLQIRRPFTRGDEIRAVDHEGEVLSIDARTLTIRTPDGETVRLPNAEVIRQPIVNLTSHGRRRAEIEVGVAYGSDVAAASRVAVLAMRRTTGVRSHPPPVAQAVRFGESGIDLALRYWHEPAIAEEWQVRHDVIVAVNEAFSSAGVRIPFPQRMLHLAPGAAAPPAREVGDEPVPPDRAPADD